MKNAECKIKSHGLTIVKPPPQAYGLRVEWCFAPLDSELYLALKKPLE